MSTPMYIPTSSPPTSSPPMSSSNHVIMNVGNFIMGFLVGLLVETIAVYIYFQLDPREKSNILLVVVILWQLYLIFTIMEETHMGGDFYSKIGILTSQVFIFDYGLRRIYPLKSLLHL